MKHSTKIILMLLALILSFSLLAAPSFAEPIQYIPGASANPSQLGEGVLSLAVGDDHCLHIYDGIYAGTYYVPTGTLLYYGNPDNVGTYVIIAGKALEALDVKYADANCGIGTPVSTFTARHRTATINFQNYCIADGNTAISADGMIGDITWTAMSYRLG